MWILFFWLDILAIFILHYLGVFGLIISSDITFISITIIVLYLVSNFLSDDTKTYFMSLFPALGFLGTIIGFAFILNGIFDGVTIINNDVLKTILKQIITGLGTAIWTTIVGTVTALLLEVKMKIINKHK